MYDNDRKQQCFLHVTPTADSNRSIARRRRGAEVSVNNFSCHQLLKGELPVLHPPKPSAVSISDDDNDRKPECSLKWLCNPDMDLCGVEVWVSEHPRT